MTLPNGENQFWSYSGTRANVRSNKSANICGFGNSQMFDQIKRSNICDRGRDKSRGHFKPPTTDAASPYTNFSVFRQITTTTTTPPLLPPEKNFLLVRDTLLKLHLVRTGLKSTSFLSFNIFNFFYDLSIFWAKYLKSPFCIRC